MWSFGPWGGLSCGEGGRVAADITTASHRSMYKGIAHGPRKRRFRSAYASGEPAVDVLLSLFILSEAACAALLITAVVQVVGSN